MNTILKTKVETNYFPICHGQFKSGLKASVTYYKFVFQTLNSISAEKNSTIIFPFPIDLVTHLLGPKA